MTTKPFDYKALLGECSHRNSVPTRGEKECCLDCGKFVTREEI